MFTLHQKEVTSTQIIIKKHMALFTYRYVNEISLQVRMKYLPIWYWDVTLQYYSGPHHFTDLTD